MQQLTIPFTNSNISLQIGDSIYYIPKSNVMDGGFDTGFNQSVSGGVPVKLGVLIDINQAGQNNIVVVYDETKFGGTGQPALPTIGDFLMFEKDTQVNTSSVIGYYMNVKFKNYSRKKVELFSVGSEISESSK